jgi:hypothetical protein
MEKLATALSLGVTATAQHRDRASSSPTACVVCELRSQISETRSVSQASVSVSLRPSLLVPRAVGRDTRSRPHAPGGEKTSVCRPKSHTVETVRYLTNDRTERSRESNGRKNAETERVFDDYSVLTAKPSSR